MPARLIRITCATLCGILLHTALAQSAPKLVLNTNRASTTDLEVSGELAGLPPGSTRFLTRADLLTLPQVTFTVKDDANFSGPTEISGVLLEDLIKVLAASPGEALVAAVCEDQYHAHYPRPYLAAHHPVLVLKINGQLSEGWPKAGEAHDADMGPYLISHRQFTPGPNILAHREEAQIPWGVVRLEFRNQKSLDAIAPRGLHARDEAVQAGYKIAQQNCLRCHNQGHIGGMKAHHSWLVLSAWATSDPEHFASYIRDPQKQNPQAQMYANPDYDAATLHALTAYFQTFTSSAKTNQKEKP